MIFCRTVPWMVLYKVYLFFFDPKSKMATIAGHSLTLDPIGNTYKDLLLRSHKVNENDPLQKCSLDGSLQSLRFFLPILSPRLLPSQNSLTLNPMGNTYKDLLLRNHRVIENNPLQKMFLGWFSTNIKFFFA